MTPDIVGPSIASLGSHIELCDSSAIYGVIDARPINAVKRGVATTKREGLKAPCPLSLGTRGDTTMMTAPVENTA